MKKNVLVTDSLFIFDEHIEKLEAVGISVTRLDKPMASEEELIEAIKGKHGYILGGIEKVTARIIEAADCLEALTFTGTDWLSYIPGHTEATKKNIAISNCPGANAQAVAEFALTIMLAMQRNIFELGRTGSKSFQTTNSLLTSHVGIVGMGTIGAIVAKMLKGIGVENVFYYSQRRKPEIEAKLGIEYLPLNELLQTVDVVTLHASKAAGDSYIGAAELAKMRTGSLLVDTSFHGAVSPAALLTELQSGRLRAAADHLPGEEFKELPEGAFYFSNQSTAYNTHDANKKASDIATTSMINMLQGKPDRFVVNCN
ncbi:MAG: NAD(P)-dependent oxidoreductase [Candidatus Melainabacteria bacterium]|nr:NAD(P)-dependent oxidoreductase [Candidatus Melainabacteria bacterium]